MKNRIRVSFAVAPDRELIVNEKGTPKAILANVIVMLKQAPEWKDVLAYNEFSLHAVTLKPAPWQTAGGNWTDYDDLKLTEWLQHESILVNTRVAGEAAQAVAREYPFHPVRDYLRGLTWDGTTRLDNWLSVYLGATDSPFARAVGARWLISAVARIFRPGCQADHTLILEGPQGRRKSTALRTLAGADWFTDHLADLSSKDSRLDLHGVWIVELAELSTLKRSLSEQVKNFLTATSDNFRPPYGRHTERIPRTNVFAGSVNHATYLMDETGNRRFWPVCTRALNIDGLTRDRDQLWAEAYVRFAANDPWWLDSKELEKLATAEQEQRYEEGVWDDVIIRWLETPTARSVFDPDTRTTRTLDPFDSDFGRTTITDVLLHAIGKDLKTLTQADRNQVARRLIHLGWARKQVRIEGKQTWCYVAIGGSPEITR